MAAPTTPVTQDANATARELQQAAATDRAATQESRSWQTNRDDANVRR